MRSPPPVSFFCAFITAAAVTAARADEARHAFSVRDMVAMERLASPQPSPDGSQVVFTRRVYDAEANRNFTSLWIVPIDGGRPRRLTNAPAADTSPRWSPDAKSIAFISDRGGSSQVWSIDPSGGEARRVSDLSGGVVHVQWSPDGGRLGF